MSFSSCEEDNCRYSVGMKDTDQRIPDAERDVLACLVRLEQATVKELQEALADVRPMQPASVMTLLKRLEARRLVTRHKLPRGKALAFRPTKKSSGAWRRLVTDLFHQAFGGDQVAFITSFFET
ncbi:MAG: BlaI/MecI/CopY family transcriptional regulator, partial [Planctomycetaceae bacterium]|nr:BlaI/MecI/CopY family transcriptional regulator [Planctomycetaceae bacterium]